MSWLFLFGVAFDGVGAFLIAWPIIRPGSAAKETVRPRYGGDHWQPFREERERRLVAIGALFLVGGFALQSSGYLIRLSQDWWAGVVVIAVTVAVGLRVGVVFARWGHPRHVWHPHLQPSERIADGFVVYGVESIPDLERVIERYLQERGMTREDIAERGEAHISGGAWTVNCPRCQQPTGATTPEWEHAICTNCGASYEVKYPPRDQREEAEGILLREIEPMNRRWVPLYEGAERATNLPASPRKAVERG